MGEDTHCIYFETLSLNIYRFKWIDIYYDTSACDYNEYLDR